MAIRPPYCLDKECKCLSSTLYEGDNNEFHPGKSLFCLGQSPIEHKHDYHGQEHVNDIYFCSYSPHGWDRWYVNCDDLALMAFKIVQALHAAGKQITPNFLFRGQKWVKQQ